MTKAASFDRRHDTTWWGQKQNGGTGPSGAGIVATIPDGGISDEKIGDRTIDDATGHSSATGLLTQLLSLLGKLIKGITGKSSFLTAPAMTIEQIATALANTVLGNGTSGHSVRWSAPTTLADGAILDTGLRAGIGAIDGGTSWAVPATLNDTAMRGIAGGLGDGVYGYSAGGFGVHARSGSIAVVAVAEGNGQAIVGSRNVSTATTPVGAFEQLHVSSTAAAGYMYQNGSGNCLNLDYNGGGTSSTTLRNFVLARSGGVNRFRVSNIGQVFANGGYQSNGADFAELMAVEGVPGDYAPGQVLTHSATADRAVALAGAGDPVLGVYATQPGYVGAPDLGEEDLAELIPVAVLGIVPVTVNDDGGAISRGDQLVVSSTGGVAKRAGISPAAGTVIGRALEAWSGTGTGTVLAFVAPR